MTKTRSKTKDTALDRLARFAGIEPEYRDAWGRVRPTGPETKRALLAAMGFPSSDDPEIDQVLKELVGADRKRPLQPVYVVRAREAPVKLDLILPPRRRELRWELKLEDGTVRSGGARTADLPCIEQREIDGERVDRRQLSIGRDIPCGYHRLRTEAGSSEASLIVRPERCWLPRSFDRGGRIWGIAAQLYLIQSSRNWGMGDFTDLRLLTEASLAAGIDMIGLNPLHALFPDTPEHASPYSPASRLLLNILYIDVLAVPGLENVWCAFPDLIE